MTVSSTTTRVTYSGNGATTAFAVTFPFFAASEIEVIERAAATGAETVKVLTTHYTVSGGGGATGTVTALVAPPSTVQWVLRRKTARTQEIDYTPNDPFPAETHEQGLDRLKMNVQEIGEEQSRSLKFPKTDSESLAAELPSSVARASRVLAFDGAGALVVSNQTLSQIEAPADAVAAAASASASAASASTSATAAAASASDAAASVSTIGLPAGVADTMLRRNADNTAYEARGFQQVFDDIHRNGADIAAAATLDLDGATGDSVDVTGNTGIAAVTLAAGKERRTRFTGTPLLTHGASLVLPGAVDIAVAAGDVAVWRGYGGGVTRCVDYQKADGTPIVAPPAGIGGVSIQKFTASGTWTKPTGVKFVRIICVGGGGGGGGCTGAVGGIGAGGGAGGYSEKVLDVTAISTATIIVGAAGAGGVGVSAGSGGNGGDTSFAANCIAKGGTGGGGRSASTANITGGAGGVAGTGDLTVAGRSGQIGSGSSTPDFDGFGAGGDSALGFGPGALRTSSGGNGLAPTSGYGGGGGGGWVDANSPNGGAGRIGICLVHEFK